jgi:hypothetical protein
MKFFVLVTFFVVGFWAGGAYGSTKTITVPVDTTVVSVDSSYCEPIYNENTGTLYVPRCWKMKQEKDPTWGERTISRTTDHLGREIENSINNGIDRQIYKVGRKIDKITGVRR